MFAQRRHVHNQAQPHELSTWTNEVVVHADGKDGRAQPRRPPGEQVVTGLDKRPLGWQTRQHLAGDDAEEPPEVVGKLHSRRCEQAPGRKVIRAGINTSNGTARISRSDRPLLLATRRVCARWSSRDRRPSSKHAQAESRTRFPPRARSRSDRRAKH